MADCGSGGRGGDTGSGEHAGALAIGHQGHIVGRQVVGRADDDIRCSAGLSGYGFAQRSSAANDYDIGIG